MLISFWSSWPNKCNDAIDDTIGMMWHWCQHQWHYLTKRIMLHLILIILTEEMHWCCWCCQWNDMTKKSHCISFWSSWHNRWNGAIDDTVGNMWHLHQHHGITWPKKLYYLLFQYSSWANEYNGAIDNGFGITSYWCQYQQCEMTKKVILHLFLNILN